MYLLFTRRPNFEFLFEKEAAERKAKIEEEKRKFKELVKREKQRIKDEEKRGQERVQRKRASESEKRVKEKEAKYTGVCSSLLYLLYSYELGVHISDGIYLGSRLSAQNYEWLKENEIVCAITLFIILEIIFNHILGIHSQCYIRNVMLS